VFEDDLAFLPANHEGDVASDDRNDVEVMAVTRAFPEEKFRGELTFIYPHVDQQTRTVAVRFELPNPEHRLRPGSTATVTLAIKPRNVAIFAEHKGDHQYQKMLAKGLMLTVPESAVIDTGWQRIVYRERSSGVYEGVEVSLGPKMAGPHGLSYFPVLGGLKEGDRVVAAGSFLVDAETRLNPAAGSIYFGSVGGASDDSSISVVRPSSPEASATTPASASSVVDVEMVRASLAKLSFDDRKLAEAQKFCAVLEGSRLGVMGAPVKVMVQGHSVFVCCDSCRERALANPDATLARVRQLLTNDSGESEAP
jgi:hypothetical protein